MKKYFAICLILLFSTLMVAGQNVFRKEGNTGVLKVPTDKIGIGGAATTAKMTIFSMAGEIPMALIGYSTPYSPYLTFLNSNQVPVFRIYANNYWWAIGNSSDTAAALLVGKQARNWLKVNGTVSSSKVISTTVSAGTLSATSATFTTGEQTDSTGFILRNRAGTRFRVYITAGGAVAADTAQ